MRRGVASRLPCPCAPPRGRGRRAHGVRAKVTEPPHGRAVGCNAARVSKPWKRTSSESPTRLCQEAPPETDTATGRRWGAPIPSQIASAMGRRAPKLGPRLVEAAPSGSKPGMRRQTAARPAKAARPTSLRPARLRTALRTAYCVLHSAQLLHYAVQIRHYASEYDSGGRSIRSSRWQQAAQDRRGT